MWSAGGSVFVSGLDRRLPPVLTLLNRNRVPHAALWVQTLVGAARWTPRPGCTPRWPPPR
jgi:amino acid transporter